MRYIIKGNLTGLLCSECEAPIANTSIRVYLPTDNDLEIARAVANVKETFHEVSADELKAKSKKLLAEAKLDENGNFTIEIPDKTYKGGALDIDWYSAGVPVKTDLKITRDDTLQFHLTTIVPLWRETQNETAGNFSIFGWNYAIPSKWFCRIIGRYGLYVICGRVVNCKNKVPVSNVRVRAFDVDLIQDDALGQDITDIYGRFQIWYTQATFSKTIFNWLNIEWPAGPDVYFRIESLSGATLLQEPRSKGHTTGRENIGHCFCAELCIDAENPPGTHPEPIPAFIRVGGYDYNSQLHSAPFQDGLTTGNYAFFSTLRLNGILSQTLNGNAMEYCFEYTEQYDGAGNPINWKRVLGNQIPATNIGYLEKATLNPFPIPHYEYNNKDYYVSNVPIPGALTTPVAADGWILVPQENDSPLATGLFVPNGNQILLDSTTLAAFAPVDLTGLVAGDSVTSTGKPLVKDKIFAIRMLVREQGNNATIVEAGNCRRIAIDNVLYNKLNHHPSWGGFVQDNAYAVCMVDIQELQAAGCSKITDQVHILYTTAHPNLGSISATLTGPGGTVGLPIGPVSEDAHGTITHNFTNADPKCAYLVTLSATALLTTGDSNLSTLNDQIAFCR